VFDILKLTATLTPENTPATYIVSLPITDDKYPFPTMQRLFLLFNKNAVSLNELFIVQNKKWRRQFK